MTEQETRVYLANVIAEIQASREMDKIYIRSMSRQIEELEAGKKQLQEQIKLWEMTP